MDLINAVEAWKTGKVDPDTGKPVSLLRVFLETITHELTPSGLKNGGQDTLLTVSDSTWTKIERSATTTPSGSGILSGRNSLKITNKSNVNIATTINTDPNGNNQTYQVGDEIYPNNSQFLDVAEKKPDGSNIDIWVRSSSGSVTAFFREIA